MKPKPRTTTKSPEATSTVPPVQEKKRMPKNPSFSTEDVKAKIAEMSQEQKLAALAATLIADEKRKMNAERSRAFKDQLTKEVSQIADPELLEKARALARQKIAERRKATKRSKKDAGTVSVEQVESAEPVAVAV